MQVSSTFLLVKVNPKQYHLCNVLTNFCYFNFTACNCNGDGANGVTCDNNGTCSCKANFMNDKCEVCNTGFYNFPTCQGKQYIMGSYGYLHFEWLSGENVSPLKVYFTIGRIHFER